MTLYKNMSYFNKEIHINGCNLSILWSPLKKRMPTYFTITNFGHGLSQYLETGCPNRGFIDLCVSKVWYKIHTANKINPIYLHILIF